MVEFVSEPGVELIKTDFDDTWPVLAARTSTLGADSDPVAKAGLIRRLASDGHHVPFEHMSATWRIEAPIFVWRQFMKHRVGVSVSEESGRYRQLQPRFYIPPADRPIKQVGKPMDYDFQPGDMFDQDFVWAELSDVAYDAYASYELLIEKGIANEVARMVLPLNTMSTAVVTMNARSLYHFLQLRTEWFGSHPQFEIAQLADKLAETLADHAPITYKAFLGWGGE